MLLLLLCAIAVSCGDGDRPTVTNDVLPTPRPAPTIEGDIAQTNEAAVAAQAVVVGVQSESLIEVRAQPGDNLPLVGQVPAGTSIQPMGQMFTTPDNQVWWQVRTADLQGWTTANLAYQGPAQTNTFSGDATYDSPAAAVAAVTAQIAESRSASEIVTVSSTEIASQGSVTVTSDLVVGDGSTAGVRLVVALSAVDGSRDAWRPVSMTQFELCSNGVNAQGVCL